MLRPFASLAFVCVLFLGTACGSAATPAPPTASDAISGDLTVFAASSLTESFNELGAAFRQQRPAAKMTFNFAGSQALRTQLENGAQADVFASADQPNMAGVVAAGLNAALPASFASNRLTVITPSEGPGAGKVKTLADLTQRDVKLALAAPNAPVGNYSRQALENLNAHPEFSDDFSQRTLANLVSEEANVRLVAQKAVLGEVDAGIVYQTDVAAPAIAPSVRQIPIPDQYNVVANYPMVTLKTSANPEAAAAFVEFVLSPAGQIILAKHGFGPPAP